MLFDQEETPREPIRGFPVFLPDDETIVWQGSASWRALAIEAFHIRAIAIYFVAAVICRFAIAVFSGTQAMEAVTLGVKVGLFGILSIAILLILAYVTARQSIFSITTKRVVIRHGVAIRKHINVPFDGIAGVSVKRYGRGSGDIALSTIEKAKIPYLHLWPFARPLRVNNPVPLLRCLTGVDDVAAKLSNAIRRHNPSAFTLDRSALGSQEGAENRAPIDLTGSEAPAQ